MIVPYALAGNVVDKVLNDFIFGKMNSTKVHRKV
jgi:hypothetical protein